MIGIIISLFISWILLHLIGKTTFAALGYNPTEKRIRIFFIGFLLAALICSSYHLMTVFFIKNNWVLNTKITPLELLYSIWKTVQSVLFEELVFRGAVLYIAIKKLNLIKACSISAVCFSIYHLLLNNIHSEPMQMLIDFFTTGLLGYTLAFAFARTKSMYLPIALHLGWNLLDIVVFSNGSLGQQILIKANNTPAEGLPSLFIFLFKIFVLPIVSMIYARQLSKRSYNKTFVNY